MLFRSALISAYGEPALAALEPQIDRFIAGDLGPQLYGARFEATGLHGAFVASHNLILIDATLAETPERLRAVVVEGERVVGVRTSEEILPAAWVIDASGQQSLVGHQLGLVQPVVDMQATATYAYYDGAGGVPGPLGRHVQLVVSIPEIGRAHV